MRFTLAFVACLGLALAAPNSPKARLLSDSFIQSINARQNQWVAKRQFPEGTPLEYFKTLASLKGLSKTNKTLPMKLDSPRVDLPETFDAREQWPACPSIGEIRNQGACGSCWAFGAVESMSDRLCITQGVQFTFSPEELVSCCTECGYGCNGGYLLDAWDYWTSNGIVSGGDQNSKLGCRPYTSATTGVTPSCSRECVSTYDKTYAQDLKFGISAYQVRSTVENIRQELYANGPLEVAFDVYEDFYDYESGVYEYTTGEYVGGHAVKLVGWGEENGTPYWLIANSWAANWGIEGFFKIKRGSDECGIESNVVAGQAKAE